MLSIDNGSLLHLGFMGGLLQNMCDLLLAVLDTHGVLHHLVETITLLLSHSTHQHLEVHASVIHHGHALQAIFDKKELISSVQS